MFIQTPCGRWSSNTLQKRGEDRDVRENENCYSRATNFAFLTACAAMSHTRWLVPTNAHHTYASPGRRAVSHNYIHILMFTICRRPFDLKHDWWLFKAVKRRGDGIAHSMESTMSAMITSSVGEAAVADENERTAVARLIAATRTARIIILIGSKRLD